MSYYKLKPTKPINNIETSNFHSTIMNNRLGTQMAQLLLLSIIITSDQEKFRIVQTKDFTYAWPQ